MAANKPFTIAMLSELSMGREIKTIDCSIGSTIKFPMQNKLAAFSAGVKKLYLEFFMAASIAALMTL